MDTFKARLPTKSQTLSVLLICLVLTNTWTILRFLHELPRYLIVLNDAVQIASMFTYFASQAFADGIIFWFCLLVLAILLPAKWLRNNFAQTGSLIALGLTVWIILKLQWIVPLFGMTFVATTFVVVVCIFLLAVVITAKLPKFSQTITDNLSVLGGLYLALDLVCIALVLIEFSLDIL